LVDTFSRNDFQLETAVRAIGARAREALWRCGIADLQAEYARGISRRFARSLPTGVAHKRCKTRLARYAAVAERRRCALRAADARRTLA
jgi:hypothetical protein